MPKTPEKPPLSIVTNETATIRPPRKLGQHGTALWNWVQRDYGIDDVGGVELLCQACQTEDRAESLAEAIARDGAVIYTRNGVPHTHPSVKDELACRAFIVRTLEKLGINVESIKQPGRPGRPQSWVPEIG